MTPEQFAALRDLIRESIRQDAVPYPWVAAVVGFLVLALGGAVKWGLSQSNGRLEDMKAVLPLMEKTLEAIREMKARGS